MVEMLFKGGDDDYIIASDDNPSTMKKNGMFMVRDMHENFIVFDSFINTMIKTIKQ